MKTLVSLTAPLRAILVCLFALAVGAPPARAADANPPDRMTYQGFLADGNGDPLGNTNTGPKNYDVIFRIWTDPTGGTQLWAEQQTLTVDKGYFSVLLGEGATYQSEPRPAFYTLFTNTANASDRYVEVTVKGIGPGNTDVTILPRLRLLTSPYAFLARNAVNAGNLVNSANGQVVSITGTYVGINRTSPTSALDVNGTVTATTFSGSGSSLTSLNANNLSSGTVPDARLSANVAKLNAGTNSFAGSVTVGGNMQIGTSSGDYQYLRLGGGNSSGYLYGSYPALSDGIHLGYNYYYDGAGAGHCDNPGGGTSRLTVGYGGLALATGGANTAPATRLFVNATGNVGIGTTTPGRLLQVGDNNIAGSQGMIRLGSRSTTNAPNRLWDIGVPQTGGDLSGVGYSFVIDDTQLGTTPEFMIKYGTGNVGIGTTNPAATLDVNGSIKVKGVAPIMIRRYKSLGAATYDGSNNTGISTTDYSAAVVGVHCYGSFLGTGSGALLHALMRQISGTWRIWFTVRHDSISDIWVDVMFIRRDLTDDDRGDY